MNQGECAALPPRDLNIPDPSKPCVPLPELVPVVCTDCRGAGVWTFFDEVDWVRRTVKGCNKPCERCGGHGSVLVDRALLRELKP